MEIQTLLSQTDKLPNVPEVVRELIQALNNPDADYGAIAEKVSKDQTLSLKILRLVNSAHFGLSRKVSSIDEAVVMLGMARLKTLVIASGFANCASNVEGIDLGRFWSESFRVATLSRHLAEQSSAEVDADIAFTAGIIHNIGRLLLHLAQPNRAMAIQTLVEESQIDRSTAEMERLGFICPEAGQALLEMWKFPEQLCIAVRQHRDPVSFADALPMSGIIHLAFSVNMAAQNKASAEEVAAGMSSEVLALAGLGEDIREQAEALLGMESGLDGLAA